MSIILSFIFCVFINLSLAVTTPHLIGGIKIPIELGRFHASLQNVTGHHVCGGVVITHRHVVTAAHCVFNAKPKYIHVVVGTANLDSGGLRYSVEKIYTHNDYDKLLKLNDIALIKIKGLFNLHKAEMIQIQTEDVVEGDNITVIGFGAKKFNGASSRDMHALNLTVFDQHICQYAMRNTREVFDNMFCTFTRIGEGTCYGDSGAPLIKDNRLVGIVSWGIPCGVGFPDVHTRISPYIPWINKILDKVSCGSCRS